MSAETQTTATREEIDKARELHGSNDIEIDQDPAVSHASGGYWVQAWLWVPDGVTRN